MKNLHIVVIGAGVGGITTAALLTKLGYRVTVLEAHVYPGGCAGTFYHKKFYFDAGATLAGGFAPGAPHHQIAQILGIEWPITHVDPAWVVHLPDGAKIPQWGNRQQWRQAVLERFPESEKFWNTQETLADALWQVSSRFFPWPPEDFRDLWELTKAVRPQTLQVVPYLAQTVAGLPGEKNAMFRAFLDSQLIISSQTTSQYASALHGCASLDLPRQGVYHVQKGIGTLAKVLADWVRSQGNEVLYKQRVNAIEVQNGKVIAVTTAKQRRFPCDFVVSNTTPWALQQLLQRHTPLRLRKMQHKLQNFWGAFVLYLGLDKKVLEGLPFSASHHQVIVDHTKPLGEGNSVFISIADPEDTSLAPPGMVSATISTHTAVDFWWQLRKAPKQQYDQARQQYTEKILDAAQRAIPKLREHIHLCLPGTPITFERFTSRPQGMVGGFPQTSIFKAFGPSTGIENLLLVGDTIFPGQSTAGVTLGAIRVADKINRRFS